MKQLLFTAAMILTATIIFSFTDLSSNPDSGLNKIADQHQQAQDLLDQLNNRN